MQNSIEIDRLRKSFRKDFPPAVDIRTPLTVPKGQLFGIVGPDGAGKTTLFRMLATLISPDEGTARVEGLDIVRDYRKLRTMIGYMPGRFSLYSDLTVRENLEFFASVFGKDVESNYGLIANIYDRLKPFENRKAGKLSGGMKQKLALSCSLIHSPAVLFLDEPTTGVDPSSRRELWENLAELKAGGMTIVVSTAYMDEANRCDRVAMMMGGRFLAVDSPKDIIAGFGRPLYGVRSTEMFRLLRDLRTMPQVEECYTFGQMHHVVMREDVGADGIARYLSGSQGHGDVQVLRVSPTLEDCYMYLATRSDASLPDAPAATPSAAPVPDGPAASPSAGSRED